MTKRNLLLNINGTMGYGDLTITKDSMQFAFATGANFKVVLEDEFDMELLNTFIWEATKENPNLENQLWLGINVSSDGKNVILTNQFGYLKISEGLFRIVLENIMKYYREYKESLTTGPAPKTYVANEVNMTVTQAQPQVAPVALLAQEAPGTQQPLTGTVAQQQPVPQQLQNPAGLHPIGTPPVQLVQQEVVRVDTPQQVVNPLEIPAGTTPPFNQIQK